MQHSCLPALALISALAIAQPAASPAPKSNLQQIEGFAREPIILFTSEIQSASGVLSSSLVVYQDGFVAAARSGPGGELARSFNVGATKAHSWFQDLLRFGAPGLPDGDGADPGAGGAFTLTILQPRTDARAHSFSYGAADYPGIQRTLDAIFLRLGI